MSNPRAQLEVGVDASEAKDGFGDIKIAARDMSAAVVAEGQRAAKGVDAIGQGSETAAQKVDRATSSLISSIQRTTAAMEAGSRTGSKYFETLAAQRGVSVEALRPYLQQLDAVAAKQNSLAGGTAKLNSQLRQVGPQFTDIVTQLAGGQSAMQVFIQQGGQLKDQFGGAGNAARALGGYVASLINPLTLTLGAAAALGYAFYEGRREAEALSRALALTGNAAGQSAGQLQDMAARVSESVGTQGQAVAAIAALAGNATVAATGNLERLALTAVAAEKTLGRSVQESVKDFEALGRSPVEASLKLNEQYRYLTAEVYRQIKALDDQGRSTEAAALAQTAYASATERQINSVQSSLGSLEKGWAAVADTAKWAWDEMLNIGRPQSSGGELADITANIARLQKEIAFVTENSQGAISQRRAEQLRQELADALSLKSAYEGQAAAQRQAAEAAAEKQRKELAGIEWQREGEKYLTRSVQMEREIAKAKELARVAGVSQLETEKRIAAVREKYTDKGASKGVSQRDDDRALSDWTRRVALLEAEAAGTAKLSAVESAYVKVLDDITSGRLKLSNASKAELATLVSRASALEQSMEAEKQLAKASEAWRVEREKAAASLDSQIAKQREENAAIGLAAEATAGLAAAKNEVTAAAQEEYAAALRTASAYAGQYAAQYEQAALDAESYAAKLRELAQLQREGAASKASADAAKESAAQWQRAGEQIEQSLTDAIMRGFEGGKDFTENFIDSIENSFKTAALRLSVQLVYSAAGSGLSAILGAAGSNGSNGGTAGGLGQFSSALSTASSLYGYAGSAASLWSAFAGTSAGGTAGGFTAGWAGGAGSIGSGLSAAGNGYAVSGAGQALGGISKVAWPLAVLYGMYMSSKAYDAGFKMDSGTYGGGMFGNVMKSVTDVFTGEPLLEKIVGGRVAAILTGSSLAAQIIEGVRKKFGAGGEKIGGETWLGGQAENLKNTSNADGTLSGTVGDISKRIADAAALFGGSSAGLKIGLAYDADPKGKANSSVSAALYGADGKAVYRQTGFDAGRGEGDLSAALGVQATRLMIAGLKASNIDAAIKGVLDQYNLNTITEAQAQEALKAASAMQQLGLSVGELWKSLGQNADIKIGNLSNRRDLAQLFGGFDQLSSAVGGAYDALLTEQQKVDLAQKNMVRYFSDLNIALPKSNAELLSLIEAQDLTSEAGRKTYSSLVSLAPAFAQLQQSLASTGDAAAQAAQAAADAAAAAFAKLQSDAEAYFRGIDRAANLRNYTSEAQSALDVVFGAIQDGSVSTAQAAAAAAAESAGAWRNAVGSIGGTLQDLRAGALSNLSPEARYLSLRGQFGTLQAATRAGDSDAAQQLGSVAQQFLQASRDFYGSGGGYQSDLSFVDQQLAASLESAKASVTVQESIQAASTAAVDELQRLNTSLGGFAGEALSLLRANYAGSTRDAGSVAITQLAQLQSATDYMLASMQAGASQRGEGYKLTRLEGSLASVQFDSGRLEYLRAGESVLEIAKRIPELREEWERRYGIKLPAYATGTAFVQGDQVAQIHHAEAVLSAPDMQILRKYGIPSQPDSGLMREVLAELKASRQVQQEMSSRLAVLDRRLQAVEDIARLDLSSGGGR